MLGLAREALAAVGPKTALLRKLPHPRKNCHTAADSFLVKRVFVLSKKASGSYLVLYLLGKEGNECRSFL